MGVFLFSCFVFLGFLVVFVLHGDGVKKLCLCYLKRTKRKPLPGATTRLGLLAISP